MNTYYGIIKDNETLLTTVKIEEKNALGIIQRQVAMWYNIYEHSNLRIAKIKKRSDTTNNTGWSEA